MPSCSKGLGPRLAPPLRHKGPSTTTLAVSRDDTTNMPPSKTFLQAARTMLKAAGCPLHTKELTRAAIEAGHLRTEGATPSATMGAQLAMSIKRHGDRSPFIRTAPGTFGLRSWVKDGSLERPTHTAPVPGTALTPFFPTYSMVRAALPILQGVPAIAVAGMRRQLELQRGTPEENKDWSRPDDWIPLHLAGDQAEVAFKLWNESKGAVNPRHFTGTWSLVRRHDLVAEDAAGVLHLTDRGRNFVDSPAGSTVLEIDAAENLFGIIAMVGELGPAKKSDLVEPWRELISEGASKRSKNYANHTLYYRLKNLRERGLVELSRSKYSLTAEGLAWLDAADLDDTEGGSDTYQKILGLSRQQKVEIREAVHELLFEMDPYGFEAIVARLLESMGYDDAEVTPRGNDKGVDVVASIEMGITTIREVIQVKRARGNIQRPVLDALRGALHRFRADRGTIITTSGFSTGTIAAANEIGAAPITLIDGPKLVELLIENGIGVRKKPIEMWELDATAFGPALGEEGEVE